MDLPRLEGKDNDRLKVVSGNLNIQHILNKAIYSQNVI